MECSFCHKKIPVTDKIYYRDECPYCTGDLHICINCEFHDRHAHKQCRETSAEQVNNKEKANFCDYFRPKTTNQAGSEKDLNAKKQLEALFKR